MKIVNALGMGVKQWSCGLLPTILAQETNVNKQNNLLTLPVSCKKSFSVRRK